MQNLIALYRLQQADSQLEQIVQELEELRNASPGSLEMAEASSALEKAKSAKREAERRQKDAELALASLEEERRAVHNKLYGGKVTNPKELSGLERDLAQLNAKREKLDDQVLGGMDTLEKAGLQLREREAAFKEVEARAEKETAAHAARVESLTRQLADLKARREEYSRALDEFLLESYVGLKERKGGVAVATLRKNSCSACYMIVPDSSIKKVKGLELEYCSSCGRILYLDQEM